MSKFKSALAAVLSLFAATSAVAQQFPSIPDRSVIGRIGVGGQSGPSQAIPFAALFSQLAGIVLPSVSGNLACFNGTKGQLQDCGKAPASFLAVANNLSDLANTATARINLGVYGVNAKNLGVKQDGNAITATVSITSGTKNLTATGAAFTAGDIGKAIMVQGAGAASGYLTSTIVTFTDATHVVLNDNAGTTVTAASKAITYCTDDSSNIASAVSSVQNNGQTLIFTDGVICHSGTNNWAFNNLHVAFLSNNTTFIHTGSGVANSFSGITNYPATQGAVGGVFGGPGRPMLKGNPNGGTTAGVKIDNWHFAYMKVAIHDAATGLLGTDSGIVGSSSVDTIYDIRISNNTDGPFIIQPGRGIDFTKPVGSIFERPIIEGTGAGGNKQVVLTGAITNTFRGGTIESGSAGGISEDSTSSRNGYYNLDVEVNGTAADWTLNGKYPVLINCSGAGTTAGSTFGSTGATLLGGKFQSLTNNDATLWSNGTEFITAFTDNGANTTFLNPVGGLAAAKETAATVLSNKTINTANGTTLKINSKTVSDMVGAGPVVAAADVVGVMFSKVTGVNFNSANTDTAIPIVLPAGFTRFMPFRIVIDHASQTLTTSTFGLFTATAAGGVAIQAGGTVNTVSSAADATNNNGYTANTTLSNINFVAASLATPSTVYFRVGTAQGAAATGDVTFSYFPLP